MKPRGKLLGILIVLIVLFETVSITFGFIGARDLLQYKKQENKTRTVSDKLRDISRQGVTGNETHDDMTEDKFFNENEKVNNAEIKDMEDLDSKAQEKEIISGLAKLLEENDDIVGWIKIEETNIDYPVMKTKDDPEFYLSHGWDKSENVNGLPFLDYRCDIIQPSQNMIIYGHNLKNGLMFTDLLHYTDREFYLNNRYIKFSTLYSENVYEVISVFKYDLQVEQYMFYASVNYENNEELEEYLSYIESKKLYDTEEYAKPGDHFLTLITCEYSAEDSRLVVVAKRLDD